MAQIRPFRAIRFAPERVDLAVTLAPPSLDDATARALARREPRNAARVVRSAPEEGDADGAAEARAGFLLADWLRAGVLVRDEEPALYLLRQTFPSPGGTPVVRQGFFALLDVAEGALEDGADGEGAAEPEAVAAAARARRARGADVEPVCVLHPDPEERVARAFEVELEREADVRFSFGGAAHELWIIDDETTTARVAQLVAEQPLFVVGGALPLAAARSREGASAEEGRRFLLSFLSALAEEGAPRGAGADPAAPGPLEAEGAAVVLRAPPLATLPEITDEARAAPGERARFCPSLPAGLVFAALASPRTTDTVR